MTFELNDREWELVRYLPVDNLVGLAAELDLIPPAEIQRRTLIVQCVERLVDRAQRDGLPLSKYDREDLEALPPDDLEALGRLQGLRGRITVRAVLKAGQSAHKRYTRYRIDHPIVLMVPTLLTAIARAARQR